MNIEPPKDAEGREVPLDTKVLYDRHYGKHDVRLFAYFANSDTWRVRFIGSSSYFAVSDMYLDMPDSWEKLDEDLYAVETYGNIKVKIYECSECGGSCEEIYGKYAHCPHCGAEVEDEC